MLIRLAAAAVAFAALGTSASALTVTPFDGNTCSGEDPFVDLDNGPGEGVGTCGYERDDGVVTPLIAKFDIGGGEGGFTLTNFEAGFDYDDVIDGSEFSVFEVSAGVYGFTYTPDEDDPILTVATVKAGNGGIGYEFDGSTLTFSGLETPEGKELSNIAFFNFSGGEPGVIPLPGAAWLLVGAIGGLAAFRRKRAA